MSSEPPRKPPPKPLSKPPGLAPLDLAAIRNTTHSPTVILSPSSSSEMATAITPTMLTPIPSSSSISELATTPTTDDKRSTLSENLSLSPNGFFSSATVATGWITSRRVKGSATESPAPQNSPSPSSSYFPTLFRSRPRSESTELIEGNKRSGKKKETKEKMEGQSTVLNFSEDVFKDRDYLPGHRGFLEIYSESFGFSPRLRTILGIDSFAEIASLEQYSSEMVKLDLETKVLVSVSGIMRIASKMKGEVHKKLLDSLRLYDRSMSCWLSKNDAAINSYQQYMRNIFFEDEEPMLILDLFHRIPEYVSLSNEIRNSLLPERYQIVYKNIIDSLEEYKITFSLELSISSLKHIISINREAIAELKKRPFPMNVENTVELKALEDTVREMEREIQEKSEILSQSLRVIPKFTQDFPKDFPLESDFFNKFLHLRNKECDNGSRVADKKPENLPAWHKESFCEKNILKICLYFFRAICNQHPKFYDMWSGEKAHDIYINEKFILKWSGIKNTEKFVHFMQQQKKYYNTGLLEIVLYKTLEYISENAQIPMNYSLIIKKALEKATAKSSKPIGKPLQDYNEAFFKEAMRVAFKHITQSPMVYNSEQSPAASSGTSGLMPKL